jgi:DNA invertase Pin-like site-specific DNA recombinase
MARAGIGLIRAAIYCRISYDPMGRALGVQRQLQDCREIAQRKGWTVVDEYIGVGARISTTMRASAVSSSIFGGSP